MNTARSRRASTAAAFVALGLALASVVALPTAAQAATFTVNDPGDGAGVGTIRYAAANAASNDTIDITVPLSPQSTVTFPVGVIFEGNGNTVTRGANANYPIFTFVTAAPGQSIVINDLNINGGVGTGSGISLAGGGVSFLTLTLDNVSMEGHTAVRGAAVDISALSQHLYVYDSEFIDNVATAGAGGAFYGDVSQAGAEFYDTVLDGNTASSFGGAVAFENHVAATPFVFEGVTATDNISSGGAGGAIYVAATSAVTVAGGSFLRNSAQGGGGALYVSAASSFTMTGPVTFAENESLDDLGGAVHLTSVAFGIDIDGATFIDNQASIAGGAVAIILLLNNSANLDNSLFESNSAASGGALFLDDPRSLSSDGVEFVDNRATAGNGGAVHVASLSGRVAFDFATFTGNSAIGTALGDGNGGAISVAELDNTVQVVDAIIRGNTASGAAGSGFGAGIYVAEANSSGFLDLGRTEIASNTLIAGPAVNGAGVALMNMGESGVRMSNVTFAQNTAQPGTAEIYYDDLGADFRSELYSLTVVGRVGIEARVNDGDIEVRDTAISATGTSVVVGAGDPIVFSHSAFSGPDNGAITDNGTNFFSVTNFNFGPLQNNGGLSRSLLPSAGSALIDNGHIGGGETWDQRGVGFPRILNGRIDIGAIETAALLAATGATINLLIPIVGGVLVLGGIAAVVLGARRRQKH